MPFVEAQWQADKPTPVRRQLRYKRRPHRSPHTGNRHGFQDCRKPRALHATPRGRPAGARPRTVRGRCHDDRSGPGLFRALAARLRGHPLDRYHRRESGARRAGGPDRRRHGGGQDRQRVAAPAAGRARRRQAHRAVPSGARRQDRAAYRRGGRRRGRRDADSRTGRRRAGHGRLRRAQAGGRSARGGRAGCARRSGRRLPATSRSTGRASRPIRMPTPRRSTASSPTAKHVARVSVLHQRIVVASMEPRGATASYDPADDSYFLRCCSQSARALRDGMATILGVPNPKLRVVTEDVGGAFGLKTGPYPEYLAILVAAKKIGRPVHWMSNRAESFLSDNHARDAYSATSSLRSTSAASFSRCASATSATWAPISARSAPTSRPSTWRAACPACTTSS